MPSCRGLASGIRISRSLGHCSSLTRCRSEGRLLVASHTRESSDRNQAVPKKKIQQWDAEICNVDYPTLAGLIQAANYLNIEGLCKLACQSVVDIIKNTKTIRELRKLM